MSQVPEFEEAAFSAPLNQVVKCKTQFGWHLLQVLSERYTILPKISYKTTISSSTFSHLYFLMSWSSYVYFNADREESMLREIRVDDLHVNLQDPQFIGEAQLIDVREPDEVYDVPFLFFFLIFDKISYSSYVDDGISLCKSVRTISIKFDIVKLRRYMFFHCSIFSII